MEPCSLTVRNKIKLFKNSNASGKKSTLYIGTLQNTHESLHDYQDIMDSEETRNTNKTIRDDVMYSSTLTSDWAYMYNLSIMALS